MLTPNEEKSTDFEAEAKKSVEEKTVQQVEEGEVHTAIVQSQVDNGMNRSEATQNADYLTLLLKRQADEEGLSIKKLYEENKLSLTTEIPGQTQMGEEVLTQNLEAAQKEYDDFHRLNPDAIEAIRTDKVIEKDRGLPEGRKRGAASLEKRFNEVRDNLRAAKEALQSTGGNILEQPAYHGSPHKFEKFDIGKIGSGEGAQAYGYGLYMAENPNVAREYRDRLSGGIESIGGEPLNLQNIKSGPLAAFMDRAYGREVAIENLERDAIRASTNRLSFGRGKDFLHDINAATATEGEALKALRLLKSGKSLPEVKSNEYLYKVDIPDDQIAKMLDWDKAVEDQPGLGLNEKAPGTKPSREKQLLRSRIRENNNYTGSQYYDDLVHMYKMDSQEYKDFKASGETSYGSPLFTKGGESKFEKMASEYLLSMGVKGIKYSDQGSRDINPGMSTGERNGKQYGIINYGKNRIVSPDFGTKKELQLWYDKEVDKLGTKNFVVFDDSIITITDINGRDVTPDSEPLKQSTPLSSQPIDDIMVTTVQQSSEALPSTGLLAGRMIKSMDQSIQELYQEEINKLTDNLVEEITGLKRADSTTAPSRFEGHIGSSQQIR